MKCTNLKSIRFLLMFLMMIQFALVGARAQSGRHTVSGIVTDMATGEAMIGVTIIDPSTNNGTVTDIDGAYSMKVAKGATIEFSYVGMKTVSIKVENQSTVDVQMEPDAVDVEAVMVVAYGTAKKSSFTGSAEVVGKKQLENRPVSNITKALDGNVAGLETTSGGGRPGAGAQVIIRGIGSINASSTPLYVVDGAPYDGDMSSLNQDDIESVSVLKDASATSLYGSRAANGVIMITTKRGKAGRAVVNFKGNVGVISRASKDYERLDQKEYMEATYDYVRFSLINNVNPMDEAQANQEALKTYMDKLGGEMYNPFNIHSSQLIDPSTGKVVEGAESRWNDNWMDAALRKVAIRQDYQLSARGGTDNTTYSMSVGYLNEQGIAQNSDYQRFTTRVAVDSKIKPWFRAALNANYSNNKSNNGASSGNGSDNVWQAGVMMAPIYPLYERDMDGNVVLDEQGNKVYDFGASRPNQQNFNAVALLYQDQANSKGDEVGLRARLDFGDRESKIKFLKDLTLSIGYSMDYRNAVDHTFFNPFTGNAVTTSGRMIKSQSKMLSSTFQQNLYYQKSINDHNINAMIGHEFYDYQLEVMGGVRTGFMFSNSSILNQGAVVTNATSSYDKEYLNSYLFKADYNYKEKYFVSGSVRADGSSRFHSNSRWGTFWSVGASWVMTKEEFMKASRRWLDNLSVKASYGCVGNKDIGTLYAWQQTYAYGYSNGYFPGVFVSQLGNPNLKWETNYNLNVGVESRMFGGRFGATVEYYNRQAKDMLLYRPLPTSSGLSGVYENVGSVQNQGVDVTLTGVPVENNNFRWQSTLIVSHNQNKVKALSNGQDRILMGNQLIQVGDPMYSYFLYKSAGVDSNTGDEQFYDKDGNVTTDLSMAQRSIQGSRNPYFRGGFTNSFSYKGFELSFLLNFSVGGKIFDQNYINLMSTNKFGNSWHKDMANRWRKPGDVTDIPRLQDGATMVASDRFLVSASYLKIQNVTLSYTFNFKNVRNVGLSALRMYLTGDNLYTVSAREGMDPQQSLVGTTGFGYVPVRTVSFGIDLTF